MTSPLDQKIRIAGPVVVTANRVDDGAVVYRTMSGRWSPQLDQAVVADTAEVARELLGAGQLDYIHAVGAYLAPVAVAADGRVSPGNLREMIRFGGPTIDIAA